MIVVKENKTIHDYYNRYAIYVENYHEAAVT